MDGTTVLSCDAINGIPPYTYEIIAGPQLAAPQSSPVFIDLPIGTYDVRVVDTCFNSFVNSVSIEPFVPLIQGDALLCVDDTLEFEVWDIPGMLYTWSGPNGFTSNAPAFSIPMVTSVNEGLYSVVLEFPDCLLDTISLQVEVDACGMPITLYSFEAELINQFSVNLNWAISINGLSSHTFLERSYNGFDFEQIHASENGPGQINYSFEDKPFPGGFIYYRLSILEGDGNIRRSNVQVVFIEEKNTFSIVPSFVTHHSTISIASEANIRGCTVFDKSGIVKFQQDYPNNVSNIELDVSYLTSGVYFIKLLDDIGGSINNSIVVIR